MKPMNSSKSVAKSSPRRVILAGAVAAALVGIMQPAARAALLVHEFGFAGMTIGLGGSANVTNNAFIFHNASIATNMASLAQYTGYLKTGIFGHNASDPVDDVWNGFGINSGNAQAYFDANGSVLFGVGIMSNDLGVFLGDPSQFGTPIYNTFLGHAVTNTDVLMRYTFEGDADLSGTIDATDISLAANGFNNALGGWNNGDNTYQGFVDATSFSLLANAFNNQDGSIPPPLVGDGKAPGVVPEPGSLGLLMIGTLGILARRRKSA